MLQCTNATELCNGVHVVRHSEVQWGKRRLLVIWGLNGLHAPLTMSITSPSAAARKSLKDVISLVIVP